LIKLYHNSSVLQRVGKILSGTQQIHIATEDVSDYYGN
jgi:hypothetical protein